MSTRKVSAEAEAAERSPQLLATVAALIQWCQDNLDKLTTDETTRLAQTLVAAQPLEKDGWVIALNRLAPEAFTDLMLTAWDIGTNHGLQVAR